MAGQETEYPKEILTLIPLRKGRNHYTIVPAPLGIELNIIK